VENQDFLERVPLTGSVTHCGTPGISVGMDVAVRWETREPPVRNCGSYSSLPRLPYVGTPAVS
jgi:hypothetical protein